MALKTDLKTLTAGVCLLFLIPALLLFQSFQDDPPGTPGHSPYHVDQMGNFISEQILNDNSLSVMMLMEYFLDRDHNAESATFWLEELQKKYGDDCMICTARGYLASYKKEFSVAENEFAKASQMTKTAEQESMLQQFWERHHRE